MERTADQSSSGKVVVQLQMPFPVKYIRNSDRLVHQNMKTGFPLGPLITIYVYSGVSFPVGIQKHTYQVILYHLITENNFKSCTPDLILVSCHVESSTEWGL